ncbi:tagaturonate reductase [Pedobacter sp. HMF7647]|uniref:Tagaturonate reductase n=1 Tax=Hufsiella arboris TaxID=2695275 RepID=A0A7K1Y4I0_9SPHI|nr:tagaturonate reductase [Hufsiella arboris]MXV49482.1 tagaturonate reductase [Hufsiella arboris]
MKLSQENLQNISNPGITVPEVKLFELPEKVLQFGTGVLLRGLPDYFIDKANRQGIFNGRIVVVKSTGNGSSDAFSEQDCLYTLCVRGVVNGEKVEENIINSSISRVLAAKDQWNEIVEVAKSADLQVVISNTTEVGITYLEEDVKSGQAPISFPGKLLAVLFNRYQAFNGIESQGLIIIPTELIPGNGKKLKGIVLELARFNQFDQEFIDWLSTANTFCDSLVDRIVPGKPDPASLAKLTAELGYEDNLLSMAEVYRLWAIEGNEKVKNVLSFAQADDGVIIAPDIEIYRELKLRLLNGTHTLSCGLAFLAGFKTVKDAMDDELMSSFISKLMLEEIASAIPYEMSAEESRSFASKVLDRFRNPEIKHEWIAITMQYSMKIKMRIVPVLLNHYRKSASVPVKIAFGFAAYLLFMKGVIKTGDDKFYGEFNGERYLINDDQAEYFYEQWEYLNESELVYGILSNVSLWGEDLSALPGFEAAVAENLKAFQEGGVLTALKGLSAEIES